MCIYIYMYVYMYIDVYVNIYIYIYNYKIANTSALFELLVLSKQRLSC